MNLADQAILTTLSKATRHIAIFVLSIILARYFSQEDYGTYLHIMLITNSVMYIAIFGIPSSIYYYLPLSINKRSILLKIIAILFFITAIVSLLVYINFDSISLLLNNDALVKYSLITVLFIVFQVPTALIEPILINTKKIGVFSVTTIIMNILYFLFIVIPVINNKGLDGIIESILLFFALQFLVITIVVGRELSQLTGGYKKEKFTLKDILYYSIPIGMTAFIGEIGRIIDRLVVSSYFEPADFAVYSRGATELPLIGIMAISVSNVLMPSLIEAYKNTNYQEMIKIWHSSVKMMAFILYPAFFYLILNAESLIIILFSEKYAESVIIFQIYNLILLTKLSTYDVLLRAMGKTSSMLKLILVYITSNIILTVLLVEVLGMVGAPLATVISTIILRFSYIRVISRELNVTFRQAFPWGDLSKIFIVALISSVPFFIISSYISNKVSLLIVGFVSISLFYLLFIKFSKILTVSEKNAMSKYFPCKLKTLL